MIILLVILLLAFYLRAYHIDYPTIGYHNMKENEYYAEALFFYNDGDFLHRRTFNFYGLDDSPGYFEEYGQMPILPYLTFAAWKLTGTGEELWMMRLIIILFMLGAIAMLYFLVKELTNNEYLSLLSSFLLAVMPLGIYFGRNIQPETPALFGIILASYFYVKWTKTFNKKHALYTGLAISLVGLLKYTFLIIGVPFLFLFPYKKFLSHWKHERKKLINYALYFIYGIIPMFFFIILYEITMIDPSKRGGEIRLLEFLTVSYWQRVWPALNSFIVDNFTWIIMYFMLIGLVFILLKYKSRLGKFVMGYIVGVIIYIAMVSTKLAGHSYYHMPFLPLVCILVAYFIFTLGVFAKSIIKSPYVMFIPLLLLLIPYADMVAANDRVFGTVFYGQDVVGDYIAQHTEPTDRFFNLGHAQWQAVCTYARRRCGAPRNVSDAIRAEKAYNIKYLNAEISNWAKLQQNKELFDYISQNYDIALVGLMRRGDQFVPTNFLLKKGRPLNLSVINTIPPVKAKDYDSPFGTVEFYIIENT